MNENKEPNYDLEFEEYIKNKEELDNLYEFFNKIENISIEEHEKPNFKMPF
jgi:hypothetical protein